MSTQLTIFPNRVLDDGALNFSVERAHAEYNSNAISLDFWSRLDADGRRREETRVTLFYLSGTDAEIFARFGLSRPEERAGLLAWMRATGMGGDGYAL